VKVALILKYTALHDNVYRRKLAISTENKYYIKKKKVFVKIAI
jgi:hypothetical protein